jgi:hypothetical protein
MTPRKSAPEAIFCRFSRSKGKFRALLVSLILGGLSGTAFAESDNFLGTVDSTWSNTGNWSLNRLPTVGDSAWLGSGDVVTIGTAVTGGARVIIGHSPCQRGREKTVSVCFRRCWEKPCRRARP